MIPWQSEQKQVMMKWFDTVHSSTEWDPFSLTRIGTYELWINHSVWKTVDGVRIEEYKVSRRHCVHKHKLTRIDVPWLGEIKDSVCNACECFHAKKSSANRYDASQTKVWTANPCVNHKTEANTKSSMGSLSWNEITSLSRRGKAVYTNVTNVIINVYSRWNESLSGWQE